jgi:RNA polymerase sigma-70 factor (ECF subfamily)
MYESDNVLISKIRSGNLSAFEHIVNRYKDKAMTLMMRIIRNRDEAEDALQEAFIKTYKAVVSSKFEERSKFSTYFYRIVYNTAIDHYKKLKKSSHVDLESEEIPDITLDHKTPGSDSEIQNLVNTYLGELPSNYSAILTMFFINDLSHEEISQTLDLPLGTVKNRIFRAKEKLREIILRNYSLESIQELYS